MQLNRVHVHVECRFARQITIVMADVSDEDCVLLISSEVRLLLSPLSRPTGLDFLVSHLLAGNNSTSMPAGR